MGFGLNNFVQQSALGSITSIAVVGVPAGGTLSFDPFTGRITYTDPNSVQYLVGWSQERLNVNLNGVVKYEGSKFSIEQGATLQMNDQNVVPVSGPASDMIEINVDGATRYIPII